MVRVKKAEFKGQTSHGYAVSFKHQGGEYEVVLPESMVQFIDNSGVYKAKYFDHIGVNIEGAEAIVFELPTNNSPITNNPLSKGAWSAEPNEVLPKVAFESATPQNEKNSVNKLKDMVESMSGSGQKNLARFLYFIYTPGGYEKVTDEVRKDVDKFISGKGGIGIPTTYWDSAFFSNRSVTKKYIDDNPDILSVVFPGNQISVRTMINNVKDLIMPVVNSTNAQLGGIGSWWRKEGKTAIPKPMTPVETDEITPSEFSSPDTQITPYEFSSPDTQITPSEFSSDVMKLKYPNMYVDKIKEWGPDSNWEPYLDALEESYDSLEEVYEDWLASQSPQAGPPSSSLSSDEDTSISPTSQVAPPALPEIAPLPPQPPPQPLPPPEPIIPIPTTALPIPRSQTPVPMNESRNKVELTLSLKDGKEAYMDTLDMERKVAQLKTREGGTIDDAYVVFTKNKAGKQRPKIIYTVPEVDSAGIPEATLNGKPLLKSKVRIREVTRSGKQSLAYRVAHIYTILGEVFRFPNKMTQKVYMATWLARNGSVIMRGVPGTGKTTLAEVSTYFLCNNINYTKSGEQYNSWSNGAVTGLPGPVGNDNIYNKNDVDFFIKSEYGTVGIAKHNPFKTPEEILYQTEIVLDKMNIRSNPPKNIRQHVATVPGLVHNNPGVMQNSPSVVGTHTERQVYGFIPKARPIVTAPIKFQNEASRMSSIVADSMLGLMAEGQVEHLGMVFNSPAEGTGSISIYDLNPHLEEQDRGIDWAFSDRIDTEIWLPSAHSNDSVKIMQDRLSIVPQLWTTIEKRKVKREEMVGDQRTIAVKLSSQKAGITVEPFTYDELQLIWKQADRIKITEKSLITTIIVMSMFQRNFRMYDKKFYSNDYAVNALLKENGIEFGMFEKGLPQEGTTFVDMSVATEASSRIGLGSHKMEDTLANVVGTTAEKLFSESRVPLGHRATSSLFKIAKAFKYLEECLLIYNDDEDNPDTSGIVKVENVEIGENEMDILWSLIPFIVSHRIHGDRIAKEIYEHYLNTQHYLMLMVETFRASKYQTWKSIIDSLINVIDEIDKEVEGESTLNKYMDSSNTIEKGKIWDDFYAGIKVASATGTSGGSTWNTEKLMDPVGYECELYLKAYIEYLTG